ncbi:NADP-dependent malic enzyme [candidate division KSB1 bacterium]|nr:NADP-dependent malic enzyme [candidate division KSB1 bacterium]
MNLKLEALDYHRRGRKGKIEVIATKPCVTQRDLSMAYTPGVAEPCREIETDPSQAYQYTAKGNLVAVVTNGSAVLGLGHIGPLAGKPVMEGKGVLFKRFADIDVFDIELASDDPDEIINAVRLMEPTFGGINLEDIKAPECFYIEETLKKELTIPVFHDDQHGTAIISGAALLNAVEIVKKDIARIRIVVNGAGAAGIACAEMYILLGAKRENIIMCDSKGVIYRGRAAGMNAYKERFAHETDLRTLDEAMRNADVFCGVSVKDCVTKEMVRSMADDPIIFAMANPDPEIRYDDAKDARDDVIMATGRSDYPNQVNNVLGFPFIFRGALDVKATQINDTMKIAAARALAELAKEDVPEAVCRAYGVDQLMFGRDYIIPKPFDPRVLLWEAPAVAKAAMETGVAQEPVDLDRYVDELEARLGRSREIMRVIVRKAQWNPKIVVYPEGDHPKILRAAHMVKKANIATPILLGRSDLIRQKIKELNLFMEDIEIIDPVETEKNHLYAQELYVMRQRKGMTASDASGSLRNAMLFAFMMVHMGDADAVIAGLTMNRQDMVRAALQLFEARYDHVRTAGMHILALKDKIICCADTVINVDPTAEELAEIAILAAESVRRFELEPHIAMLSFSNFGSVPHPFSEKVRFATELARRKMPDLIIDGEMQADTAVVAEILEKDYPFSNIRGGANVLIFPDLASGNITYKLLMHLGGAEAIGPIFMGLKRSVQILQPGCEVTDIVNLTAIGVVAAQNDER